MRPKVTDDKLKHESDDSVPLAIYMLQQFVMNIQMESLPDKEIVIPEREQTFDHREEDPFDVELLKLTPLRTFARKGLHDFQDLSDDIPQSGAHNTKVSTPNGHDKKRSAGENADGTDRTTTNNTLTDLRDRSPGTGMSARDALRRVRQLRIPRVGTQPEASDQGVDDSIQDILRNFAGSKLPSHASYQEKLPTKRRTKQVYRLGVDDDWATKKPREWHSNPEAHGLT